MKAEFNIFSDTDFEFWQSVHQQQDKTNEIVKEILKQMAKTSGTPYPELRHRLSQKDFVVIMRFWAMYRESKHAVHDYEYISYSNQSKKFLMWTQAQEAEYLQKVTPKFGLYQKSTSLVF